MTSTRNENNVVRVNLKRIETSIRSINNYKAFYTNFWAAYVYLLRFLVPCKYPINAKGGGGGGGGL